jgi:hypothetical protein
LRKEEEGNIIKRGPARPAGETKEKETMGF